MARYPTHPSERVVKAIAAEEAIAAGITLADILGPSTKRAFSRPRFRAWRRIISETGCSQSGLAFVWGCERRSINRALATAPEYRRAA